MFRFNKSACYAALDLLQGSKYDFSSNKYDYEYCKYSCIFLLADTLALLRSEYPIIGGTYIKEATCKNGLLKWQLPELKNLSNVQVGVDTFSNEAMNTLKEAEQLQIEGKHKEYLPQMEIYGTASMFFKIFPVDRCEIMAEEYLDEFLGE